ncbi:UBP2 [Candida pseudojiufengensis]|uniref:UBP2 n=1 Tax=Candida pseudojiufengensis TaxID=497109 RepID=UPI002224F0E3|nr:UBP2 [Candida pseudojiufengensis]KAI5962535.1 UBP2 [Candida pseudojiufengensis]
MLQEEFIEDLDSQQEQVNYQQPQTSADSTSDSDNKSPLTYHSNKIAVSQEEPPTQFKSRNPFRTGTDLSISQSQLQSQSTSENESKPPSNSPPQYNESQLKTHELNLLKTNIPHNEIIKYPFKTLNRILDDIKWSVPILKNLNYSLLNNKPIDYSNKLQNFVNNSHHNEQIWILNEKIDFCPSTEIIQLQETNQVVTIIRGVIASKSRPDQIHHFKLIILENASNPFVIDFDKNSYHLIPKSLITRHDLDLLLENYDERNQIIDDSYYKCATSPNNQILRISIFKPEFNQKEDFEPLIDEKLIKERFLSLIERHPDLSKDVIPTPVNCINTLIKVLKGPLTYNGPEQRTISLKGTAMETSIDVNLLLQKLSFTLSSDEEHVIPPNLNEFPQLKESFKRKSAELIFFATKVLKDTNNSFHQYSFSDNMVQVFNRIPECDKNTSIHNFNSNYSNRFQYFIALSASAYFSDEIIIKCFENSVRSDPINQLYYIDYLKDVSNFLQHNSQNIKLNSYINKCQQQSESFFGYKDLQDSLKIIGYPLDSVVKEDVIIAMYKELYKNDPRNYQYYRDHLKRIAIANNSESLKEFLAYEIIPMNLAINELGIEEITEDEVVITAFEFKVDDIMTQNMNPNSNEIKMLNKALTSIAINRRSNLLLNYLETKYPEYVKIPELEKYTLQMSYEVLNSDSKTSEFEIINQFQIKLLSNEKDIRILRHCLRSIGEDKKSEILLSYLKTGKIDSSLLPPENWPAGLDNIGNTCYLNSLLQYYFCIKPLRDLILNFDSNNYNLNEFDANRKIGGRKVEESEKFRSNQFIYQLQNLFKQMIHTDKRCVAPSKELAYLSFLPLSQPVNFKEPTKHKEPEVIEILDSDSEVIENEPNQNGVVEEDKTLIDIDNEDDDMNGTLDPPVHIETHTVEPQDLVEETFIEKVESNSEEQPENSKLLSISTDQIESTIEIGRQQDVTECIENVIFQIESALPPEYIDKEDGEQIDLIKKLFYGKTKQTIQPIDKPDSIRESTERFNSLIINVSDHPKSIYDSLDNYFNEDLVKLEEGLVKKSVTITELPEIMQFHVQRVMFDREKLMAYKSIEPIPFSSKIYLDRYLDTKDEIILNKRSEVFNWKNQIIELNNAKNEILQKDENTSMTIIDNLITTKKFLENRIIQDDKLSIELTTIQVISDEILNLQNQLVKIDSKINYLQEKINNQFIEYNKIGYSIFAIFIHRGEASYGHYWIYIKDPHQKNIFRKYNDEIITEVQDSEIFNFLESNTATPYYIVYVKDELENQYINPLNRIIEKCG